MAGAVATGGPGLSRGRRASSLAHAAAALLLVAAIGLLAGTRGGALLMARAMHDDSPPIDAASAQGAQAIVLLGGRTERVTEAARLRALTGLPILAAGKGSGDWPFDAESEKMAWLLRTRYGIEPRWVEARSVNTHENAVESWCLLADQGVRRIVLITDAGHMLRARWEFEAAGFTVLRDPIPEPEPRVPRAADFRPSRAGLKEAAFALADWGEVGLAVLQSVVGSAPRCGQGATAAAKDASPSVSPG